MTVNYEVRRGDLKQVEVYKFISILKRYYLKNSIIIIKWYFNIFLLIVVKKIIQSASITGKRLVSPLIRIHIYIKLNKLFIIIFKNFGFIEVRCK